MAQLTFLILKDKLKEQMRQKTVPVYGSYFINVPCAYVKKKEMFLNN